jgi:hypothetical protein
MQGALRCIGPPTGGGAATSRNEEVARRGLSGCAGPPVVRVDAAGLWPTAVERESGCATQTNRPG